MKAICRLTSAFRFLALIALLTSASAAHAAGVLYFADIFNPDFDAGTIRRVNSDGSGEEPLVTVGGGLRAVAVDAAAGKLYWADVNNFVIGQANLDGSDQISIISSGLEFPSALLLDPAAGNLYWGDQSSNFIYRAGLDGSNPIEFITSSTFHRGLALDAQAGRIYWSTSPTATSGAILNADLNGFDIQTTIPAAANSKPARIALHLGIGKIYWNDTVSDTIRRADLNGGNQQTIFQNFQGLDPRSIAIDTTDDMVYWGQDADFKLPFGQILRMNLDGTTNAFVAGTFGLVQDLVFVPSAPTAVTIVSANPPADNPYVDGQQPFVDVLDTGDGPGLTHGIGGAATPAEGDVAYGTITVAFSANPEPVPAVDNVVIACTGGSTPCPSVTGVTDLGGGSFGIELSGPIPPAACTTLSFAGSAAGQQLRYQSLPGDTSMNGMVNTQDLLSLIQALNNGDAAQSANLARYDLNRSAGGGPGVNTQDLLRLVQLLNGVNTTQAFNGATAAACP